MRTAVGVVLIVVGVLFAAGGLLLAFTVYGVGSLLAAVALLAAGTWVLAARGPVAAGQRDRVALR